MDITQCDTALQCSVSLKLRTPLLLRSGIEGEFTDSSIERTWAGRLHINGYVWSSLIRRAISRVGGAEHIAVEIGKPDKGVSPLWCEPSFVKLPATDIRPGIRIHREWGATCTGALYEDEVVPPGLAMELDFNYFCKAAYIEDIEKFIGNALWVISEGIENIGGGWSYGLGRLTVLEARYRKIGLLNAGNGLWDFKKADGDAPLEIKQPVNIIKPWAKFALTMKVSEGQLLAVHSGHPLADDDLDRYLLMEEMPDHYVFKGYEVKSDGLSVGSQVVIPGKAIRQAIFSTPVERMLRAEGKDVCQLDKRCGGKNGGKKTACNCELCRWFGSTENGGIISVGDAVVEGVGTDGMVVLRRVHLCEHSMQNMNLFSGEYLKRGTFTTEVIIDRYRERERDSGKELIANLACIVDEAKGKGAPPGWHRLGATSTCTGQVEVTGCEPEMHALKSRGLENKDA